MPPEQFSGRADARGDIYSLGMTLYELLTLQSPFSALTPHHLIQMITDSRIRPPRQFNADIPKDLETIVLKAVAREPNHRYQTAADFAEDLRRFLDDRPITARRIGLIGRAWRWCLRNPALAAATATAAVLMIAVTVVSAIGYVLTAAANHEAAQANLGMQQALRAEKAQRQHAEETSALSLAALNRMYERFAPTRLLATPPALTDQGAQLPLQPSLPPEGIALMEDLLRTYEQIAQAGGEFPKLKPEAAQANHRIGDIRQRLGRFEAAAAAYRLAIEQYELLPLDT